jgi:O-acetyl-ADP-ribose deacetylase (regulator of RNase III)
MSETLAVYPLSENTRLEIAWGDLTQERVDAVVNAANNHLSHGAGLAAAIVRAGGPEIQQESNDWVHQHGLVTHAEPADTTAGKMPARRVIHAVGPIWGEGMEDHKLAQAVTGSLHRAEELNMQSVAFPAISTGIFGFPKDRAARVMLQAFKSHFAGNPNSTLHLVRLTLFNEETAQLFVDESRRIFDRELHA